MEQDAFHCQDCEWFRAVETVSARSEAIRGAISHHVETGHEIVSDDLSGDVSPAERPSDPTPPATQSDD
ncbi:MAG: hypothetical protein M8354_02040 [Halalkalicoccus sp.]|nr:hypothetical protein [Halalkalicoccus sp.]